MISSQQFSIWRHVMQIFIQNRKSLKDKHKSYHANRKVVIDDVVRHWVSFLIFIIGYYFEFPPVQ